MIRKETSKQLADSISKILNVAPALIDPECSDDCTAKITKGTVEEDDQEEAEINKSRKRYVDLQDVIGSRYAGKQGNRKNLGQTVEKWIENDYIEPKKFDSSSSEFSDSEENEIRNETSEDDEDSENNTDDTDDNIKSNTLYNTNIKQINEPDADIQLKKAASVRNQLNIWENLLEIRIQLQKCLISANKMPQNETFTEILTQSEKFREETRETQKNVENVLNKLLNLQLLLRNNYPETNELLGIEENDTQDLVSNKESKNNKKRASIQETPKISSIMENEENPCKRIKLLEYEKQIAGNFDAYTPYRNSVILKWDGKTRVAFNRNNNTTHTAIKQIEYLLNDKQKMIKRTQRKRSNFNDSKGANDDKNNIDTDPEIFDDNDFYHQMLKEFIETKSVDVTDPIKLGKQWVHLQNMRNEIKRKIDTKATKGRKIRYTVHTKLVNFMAPIDYNNITSTETHTELYNSLFGKGQNKLTT